MASFCLAGSLRDHHLFRCFHIRKEEDESETVPELLHHRMYLFVTDQGLQYDHSCTVTERHDHASVYPDESYPASSVFAADPSDLLCTLYQ